MTLVLSTTERAAQPLRDNIGFGLPPDFVMAALFDRGRYFLDGLPVEASQLFSAVRSSSATNEVKAEYRTLMGALREAPENTLRIGRGPRGGQGLIVESGRQNLFRNSAAPETHSLNIVYTAARVYILWIEGPGSITVSGSVAVVPGQSLTATEGKPAFFTLVNPGNGQSPTTFTVSGQPTFAQCEPSGLGAPMPTSRIHNPDSTLQYRRADFVTAAPSLLSRLAADWTLVLSMSEMQHNGVTRQATDFRAIFGALSGSVSMSVLAGYGSDGSRTIRARVNGSAEVARTITLAQGNKDTVVIAKSSGNLRVAANGQVATMPSTDLAASPLNEVQLGGSAGWVQELMNGVFRRIHLYTRALPSDEMMRISRI